MGSQKWFRSKEFVVLLLSVLGVALAAAAEEITRRLGNGRKKSKKRKRGEQTKKKQVPSVSK